MYNSFNDLSGDNAHCYRLCEDHYKPDVPDVGLDDDPEIALGYMDSEFSKWSYGNREGIDAVTGVVMGASSDLHANLVNWDITTWSNQPDAQTQDNDLDLEHCNVRNTITKETMPDPTKAAPRSDTVYSSNGARTPENVLTNNENSSIQESNTSIVRAARKNENRSKRALLIAKCQATNNSHLLKAQSAGQKRQALRRGKNRKLATPSMPENYMPPDNSKTLEIEPVRQLTPNYFVFENTDAGCRNAVALALNKGILDPEKETQAQALIQLLTNFDKITSNSDDKAMEGEPSAE